MNNFLLSKERLALGEQTICAERIVKEAVRLIGSVINISITKELIASARRAYAEYTLQQQKEELEKKAQDKKKEIRNYLLRNSQLFR